MLSAIGTLKYKLALGACVAALAGADLACAADAAQGVPTASPIKHVIIIIGENSSFDHAFETGFYPAVTRFERALAVGARR